MKTTADILIAAKARIADPKHWTQGAFAEDAEGESVSPASPNAVCWCAIGALRSVTWDNGWYEPVQRLMSSAVDPSHGLGNIPTYNDLHTHAEVLALFDKAIALAQKEEAEDGL